MKGTVGGGIWAPIGKGVGMRLDDPQLFHSGNEEWTGYKGRSV